MDKKICNSKENRFILLLLNISFDVSSVRCKKKSIKLNSVCSINYIYIIECVNENRHDKCICFLFILTIKYKLFMQHYDSLCFSIVFLKKLKYRCLYYVAGVYVCALGVYVFDVTNSSNQTQSAVGFSQLCSPWDYVVRFVITSFV